jgi:hypothetical protein
MDLISKLGLVVYRAHYVAPSSGKFIIILKRLNPEPIKHILNAII